MIFLICTLVLISQNYSPEMWTWGEATGNVHHYNVYVKKNDEPYQFAGVIFAETGVTPHFNIQCLIGSTYCVKTEAVDAAGNIGPMSEASDPYLVTGKQVDYSLLKPVHGGK